ncbi:ATP-binding protein [Enterococcus sp. DIV1420a]|uniref:ATP-binding protein n=1 Tax=Enterococcus sp. DIV1420a TaxID=2774672 RepID=UPI003F288F47
MNIPKFIPKFPIKYLEDNLVFNRDGTVYAYYELMPYSYGFVGQDKAFQLKNNFSRMVKQYKKGRFRLYMCSSEEKIKNVIARSKKEVKSKGELKELAFQHLEGVEEILINMNGEYELSARFFIGFELLLDEEKFGKGRFLDELVVGVERFFNRSNTVLFNEFEKIASKEIERYKRLERLLYSRITKHFTLRKTEPKDIAYIITHLNGKKNHSLEETTYFSQSFKNEEETYVFKYDTLKLGSAKIIEYDEYLEIIQDGTTEYVSYLALSHVTGTVIFPFGSEFFYYSQSEFDYPVDVSLDIDVLENKSALAKIRGKKMDLKDIDESGLESGHDVANNILEARQMASELEADLEDTKDNMYKISLVARVSASTHEELLKRESEVRSYFDDYKMMLETSTGDQLFLHYECFPSGKRTIDDYVQYVEADFIASSGFGATQQLGDNYGIPLGFNVDTGKTVYIRPWLAAQGTAGTNTNALAKALVGSLGGGKSLTENLIAFWSVLFGGLGFLIDPKGERTNWQEDLPYFSQHLKTVNITNSEENLGLLDPFSVMSNTKDQEALALDILTYITGISVRDEKRFPCLQSAVEAVAQREKKGLLFVIDELQAQGNPVAKSLAKHINSFKKLSIAGLLFGNGEKQKALDMSSPLNIALVQDLTLPEKETKMEDYNPSEILSVAIMMILATYSLDFIKLNRAVFKSLGLDESWAWLNVAQGKILGNKLVRAGRSMNAGIDFSTQNTDDLGDEKMKNNIGMKFIFRSNDRDEIEKALAFCNLEATDDNIARIMSLQNGECLFADIHGNVGIIYVYYWFEDLFHAFDTRPPMEEIEE